MRVEILSNGVKTLHKWGYAICYGNPEEVMTTEEKDTFISQLSALPSDALKNEEKTLLGKLKEKRKTV